MTALHLLLDIDTRQTTTSNLPVSLPRRYSSISRLTDRTRSASRTRPLCPAPQNTEIDPESPLSPLRESERGTANLLCRSLFDRSLRERCERIATLVSTSSNFSSLNCSQNVTFVDRVVIIMLPRTDRERTIEYYSQTLTAIVGLARPRSSRGLYSVPLEVSPSGRSPYPDLPYLVSSLSHLPHSPVE